MSSAITTEALGLCDILMTKGSCYLRQKDPSEIAAIVIYFARKNVLQSDEIVKLVRMPYLWPEELAALTRCSEYEVYNIICNPEE